MRIGGKGICVFWRFGDFSVFGGLEYLPEVGRGAWLTVLLLLLEAPGKKKGRKGLRVGVHRSIHGASEHEHGTGK